jgi:Kef-type K+ transport system membrane component KefB
LLSTSITSLTEFTLFKHTNPSTQFRDGEVKTLHSLFFLLILILNGSFAMFVVDSEMAYPGTVRQIIVFKNGLNLAHASLKNTDVIIRRNIPQDCLVPLSAHPYNKRKGECWTDTERQGETMLTGQILLQLIVILLVVQIFGNLSKRIGQQWVIGEILAGLALGPSLLGALWPDLASQLFPASTLPTLQALGDIGLILYMFSLGARLDTHLMLGQSRSAIFVSLSGILLPLFLGSLLGFFLYPKLAGPNATQLSFMLLVGTAMAITAFPVLARLLAEKKMLGTKVGILALTCASVDDVMAWCLLAYVTSLANPHGTTISVISTVGLTILFATGMLIVVRPLLKYTVRRVQSKPLQMALSIILLFLAAYTTNWIGIHPVFGAFIAGICLPRSIVFTEQVRSLDQVNTVIFLPIFFVYSGLKTQIGLIYGFPLWGLCLLVLLTACVGKIVGGTLSTRIAGQSWRDALTIGILMNTRGLVELIVLNIGLQLGILSPTLFAMLVIMAIVTTMMASPLLPLLGYRSSATQAKREDVVEATVQQS